MEKRYARNRNTISEEENRQLKNSKVCVAGCGGIGGGLIESLVRIGVGHITAVDGDVFDETNLNRQVLSNELNLGRPKALEAAAQMKEINSEAEINPVYEFITEDNVNEIVRGHDVVADALDNITARKLLEKACRKENIPLVHGAIAGWNGQVSVIMPGDNLISSLYYDCEDRGEETETGNPSFTPAVVSAIEAAEVIKILLKKQGALKSSMLMIDLLNHQYDVVEF